jgi:hypothetical protein
MISIHALRTATSIALAALALGLPWFAGCARAQAAPYCADLKRVTALAATREKFLSIAGRPREGNFMDTSVALTNWKDCALYGSRSYTCDSHALDSPGNAEKALARIAGEIRDCLGEGWIEDRSRSSPVYIVFQNAPNAASITLSTDETDEKRYVVRLILFLRSK